MPKQISGEELEAIRSVIRGHPEGIGVDVIRNGLEFELPPRTLQRRLNHLEAQNRIKSSGSGKGKRYSPVSFTYEFRYIPPVVISEPDSGKESIPLSELAKEIRDSVRVPQGNRKPVGYDFDFLRSYIPNETRYIPEFTSAELSQIGRVGVSDLPAGTYLKQVLDRLLIDLSWNSSRLEGNTYSLLETEHLLEFGEGAGGKNTEETQMILNHKAAIEMLAEDASEIGFNRYTVCNLHAVLAENLIHDPKAWGRVRSVPVGIGGTVFHPLDVPQQIEECFLEILEKAEAIEDPFEQAFFAMVHLPYLQPFEDVNKRVSRLAANIPLVKFNLCPLSFVDVPQEDYISAVIGVYEQNRIDYLRDVFVWAYQRSAARYSTVVQALGKPDPLRLRLRDEIKRFVREVVVSGKDKREAAAWIAGGAEREIPEDDRVRFVEIVETELLSLHEGNLVGYRLRPSQFADWQKTWR